MAHPALRTRVRKTMVEGDGSAGVMSGGQVIVLIEDLPRRHRADRAHHDPDRGGARAAGRASAVKRAGLALLSAALCACAAPKPPNYPYVEPGPGIARLLIDTYLEATWTKSFRFEVYVDGFRLQKPPRKSASDASREERNAARRERARFGLRLEPGNHQVVIVGLIGSAPFDPLVVVSDVVAGGNYTIRFVPAEGTAFGIRYEGWSDDESAWWPRERRVEMGL